MFEFYISPDTEKQKLMDMFCVPGVGVSLEYRANQYHFPIETARKMYDRPRYEWDKEVDTLIKSEHLKNKNEMQKAITFFKDFWHKNTAIYQEPLFQFFQKEIPTYRVLLACYLDVISNWSEPDIVINFKQYRHSNVLHSVYSLLFETVLSQIFIHIRATNNSDILPDETAWGLSELSACVILNRLYPAFRNSRLTGYPQLDKHIQSFEERTGDAATLSDFLEKVIAFQL